VSDEVINVVARRNHKRFILCLLCLMILVNLAVRYPLDDIEPMGSDTYFTLDLGRGLAEEGRAAWILSPLSYFGLYPLSYPSGTPFVFAEFHLLTGVDWNAVALVFSILFTLLFILGGFMLFRAFRLRDDLSALLAGLMALSPLFLYFTYQQASGRGFLIPIFVLGLFIVVWPLKRSWGTPIVFFLLTFAAFAIHRSSLLIVLFEGMAGLVLALAPIVIHRSPSLRRIAFAGCVAFGMSLVVWPTVPYLNDVLGNVDVISSSFRAAEWEFRTGYFFNGQSLAVLLVNLATNYVGSLGIILLMLPFGFMALYPSSRDSRERDMFLIACFLGFAPFVWRAQYIQLIIMPFAYLLAGLAIQRRRRVNEVLGAPARLLRKHPRHRIGKRLWERIRVVSLTLFIVLCLAFSMWMFAHRLTIVEVGTDEKNWPNDSEANTGIYLSNFETDNKQFISVSGIIDRRVSWFSYWDSPITDATGLQASGYLKADTTTFVQTLSEGNYIDYMMSFYNVNSMFQVDRNTTKDWYLYNLSWSNIYGFFHLYFINDRAEAWIGGPYVSTDQARITIIVEINAIGDKLANIYMGEGVLPSPFLRAISSNCYILYENEMYRSLLIAHSTGG